MANTYTVSPKKCATLFSTITPVFFGGFLLLYQWKQERILYSMLISWLVDIIHRVQEKGSTVFFAVTFTNVDGFS